MDRQERHELEQNDLESFFQNFGDFWNKYGNAVLFFVMLAALAFAGYRFFNYRYTEAHETAWADLAGSTSPQAYTEVAADHDNTTVQALAYLRGGDLLLAQALSPDEPAQPEPAPTPEGQTPEGQPAPNPTPEPAKPIDRAATLNDAAAMYAQALGAAKDKPLIALNARLGAAAVAESQGKFDEAKAHYEAVAQEAGEKFPVLAAQAKTRLGLLDTLKTPVAFAPDPPAPATPAGASSSAPGSTGSLLQIPGLSPSDLSLPSTTTPPPTNAAPPAAPAPAPAPPPAQ